MINEMIDKELETEFSEIVDKHKELFSDKYKGEFDLVKLENNLQKTTPAKSNLLDELLAVANKYIIEKDIQDSEEIGTIIQNYYSDFLVWCVQCD